MKRHPLDFIPPVLAGSLVGLAAVLTLLPIALAIGDAGSAEKATPNRPEARDAATLTPPPPSATPRSIVSPRPGAPKEIST